MKRTNHYMNADGGPLCGGDNHSPNGSVSALAVVNCRECLCMVDAELATLRARIADLESSECRSEPRADCGFVRELGQQIRALEEKATSLESAGRNMAVCLDRFREEHDEDARDGGEPVRCSCARCQKAEHYSGIFRALLADPEPTR